MLSQNTPGGAFQRPLHLLFALYMATIMDYESLVSRCGMAWAPLHGQVMNRTRLHACGLCLNSVRRLVIGW